MIDSFDFTSAHDAEQQGIIAILIGLKEVDSNLGSFPDPFMNATALALNDLVIPNPSNARLASSCNDNGAQTVWFEESRINESYGFTATDDLWL